MKDMVQDNKIGITLYKITYYYDGSYKGVQYVIEREIAYAIKKDYCSEAYYEVDIEKVEVEL